MYSLSDSGIATSDRGSQNLFHSYVVLGIVQAKTKAEEIIYIDWGTMRLD